jgi:hypothetical protein
MFMYNLQLISSKEEIDLLLRMAARDKRAANLRKESLALRNENATDNEVERNADVLSAQSEIASLEALIKSLPEGQRKEFEITKKMAVEVRLRRLTQGNSGESPATIVERSYDADLSEREVAGIDAFITSLETRKKEMA